MAHRFDPARAYRMSNPIQDYEWGSLTAIPELLGTEPDGAPQAELWMGAHPKAPSSLAVDGEPEGLPELIDRFPNEILGRRVVERFGPRLPFLFKVLAAGRALSIQAHPNREQAQEGFRRENELGIPLSAPERNYQDDNHKPEVICGLTDFWGMCGFRPVEDIRRDLSSFRGEEVRALRETLEKGSDAEALRRFVEDLLHVSAGRARSLSVTVAEQCRGRSEPRFEWVRRLAMDFPGDAGVLAPLFLNTIHLRPGEAIYLKAGELHAYLEGTGVELMANSDNVLRGGLTTKHIDVGELLRVLSFGESEARIIRPSDEERGLGLYSLPISEFRLAHIRALPNSPFVSAATRSAEILLCVKGDGQLSIPGSNVDPLLIGKGVSVLVPAAVPEYTVSGNAELFRADVPDSSTV